MLKRRVENEEEDVKVDPSPISSFFSANVNVMGVEDLKLRDEEQDEEMKAMKEEMRNMMEMFQVGNHEDTLCTWK